MGEAVFRIRTEGGADLARLLADAERLAEASRQRIGRASRASRQRTVQETVQAAGAEAGAYRASAVQIERQEKLVTRAKLRELALQSDAQKKFAQSYAEAHKRATAALEAEVGKRGNLTDREKRQVEILALAMIVKHDQAERRRTAATEREARRRRSVEEREGRATRQFVAGAPSAAAGAGLRGIEAYANYGDDVRQRQQAREQVELRSTQIAAGDIGDAGAAGQLNQATQRISEMTGLDPQGVIDAIGQAQASFSSLATAADRGTYLNDVLPMLAQAAVATNSSLEDMVNAAGEYQRQLNISGENLPQAIAQAIAEGRLGSIGFKDVASHMGVVAGAASRTVSSAPADSMRSRALVGTLFQFAGRAGGSGDEAATRARAFFDNLSSGRGQGALRATLGYNPFDASGQIARRRGETQDAAFQRIVQDTYRRTGGNSTQFLDAMAGNNTRSRTLGDQLFRDLRAHGGNLSDFRGIIDQSLGATTESAVGQPFRAITGTEANTRARENVRRFYGLTGDSSQGFRDTEDQIRRGREAHPFLGGVVGDNAVFRGTLDIANQYVRANGSLPTTAGQAAPRTRAEMQRALARDEASASVMNELGPVRRAVMPRETVDALVERRTTEALARLQLRDQRGAGQGNVTISDDSIRRLADALSGRPLISGHDAVHRDVVESTRGPRGTE